MWPRKKQNEEAKEPEQRDPNDPFVEYLNATYPYRQEALSVRSLIRLIVFVVQTMKSRGMI